MDKRLTLEDGNLININSEGGRIVIDRCYLENGEPSKVLTMSMGSDFGFEGFSFSDANLTSKDLSFSVPLYDPLYKHLCGLLQENDDLIIEDDLAREEKKKYLRVKKDSKGIVVTFNNDLEDSLTDRFIITVINIVEDGRSIIDREGLDTKKRLITFFRNISKDLLLEKESEVEER